MPRTFGNLSIRPKLVALLAVPVAGAVLLGVAGAADGLAARRGRVDRARLAVYAAAGATGDWRPPAGAPLRAATLARLGRLPYRRYVEAQAPAAATPGWPGEVRQIAPLRRPRHEG